jgi:hypothetical protein
VYDLPAGSIVRLNCAKARKKTGRRGSGALKVFIARLQAWEDDCANAYAE